MRQNHDVPGRRSQSVSLGSIDDDNGHLQGALLKFRRGRHHGQVIQLFIQQFLNTNPYKVVPEADPKTSHGVVFRASVREQPPLEWGPIIGDAAHNWRSTLDHIAWQLVKVRGNGETSRRTQFPIFDEDPFIRLEADDPPEVKKKRRGARKTFKEQVRGMREVDVALIKRLQPYNRMKGPKGHPLSVLARLSNWDKHNELALSGQTLRGQLLRYRNRRNARFQIIDVKPPGLFEEGTELGRGIFVATGPNPAMHVDLECRFDIAFEEGPPLDGLGVKEALIKMGYYVSYVLLRFKARFDKQI
jgi:hypothetical protein